MYIYLYIYIYVFIYIFIYIYVYICIYIYIYVYIYKYTIICTLTHTHTHMHKYIRIVHSFSCSITGALFKCFVATCSFLKSALHTHSNACARTHACSLSSSCTHTHRHCQQLFACGNQFAHLYRVGNQHAATHCNTL